MILIADSGSTKTEWCLVEKGRSVRQVITSGTNPYFQSHEEIDEEIKKALWPVIESYPVEAVYFYGAGCAFPEKNRVIAEVMQRYLPVPVEVFSDLMGAARSLCGNEKGIACILGTGSNSCLYDGVEIIRHTPPLGYVLGDEGSGAVLGRQLVSDCLKRRLPDVLCEKFLTEYELTPEIILERVYKQPFPNRFLASLSRFLLENITEQPIYNIVYDNFRSFLIRNVLPYEAHENYPIHCTGSIAYHYRKVLTASAISLHLTIGKVEKTPMPGLITYHVG